jgi:hypothetical protein
VMGADLGLHHLVALTASSGASLRWSTRATAVRPTRTRATVFALSWYTSILSALNGPNEGEGFTFKEAL